MEKLRRGENRASRGDREERAARARGLAQEDRGHRGHQRVALLRPARGKRPQARAAHRAAARRARQPPARSRFLHAQGGRHLRGKVQVCMLYNSF